MVQEPIVLGRVLRATTGTFSFGCRRPIAEQEGLIPEVGALVRAPLRGDAVAYGLIYNVSIEDDPLVRELVAAGVEDGALIADQRQRQVPVVVDVLVAGYGLGQEVFHRLPPRPPTSLDQIYACSAAELTRFTARHDWMHSVLLAKDVPADALLPATLRAAAEARPPDQRTPYLLEAGRTLARLLALDLPRLDGILRQLR
jgi:hypothetical protein